MARTRGQLRLEMGEGWAAVLKDLMPTVMEALQAAGSSEPQEEGLGFCKATAVVSLVCAGWKAVHDAAVKRLVLRHLITDKATGMLVRRFPAVTSVEANRWRATDTTNKS